MTDQNIHKAKSTQDDDKDDNTRSRNRADKKEDIEIVDPFFCIKIKEGNPDAYSSFYDEYSPVILKNISNLIRSLGHRITGGAIDPQDVLHDAFLRLLDRREKLTFNNPITLRNWLIVTARHLVFDKLRKDKNICLAFDEFWETLMGSDTCNSRSIPEQMDFMQFFRGLDDMDQKLVFLRFYEGNSSKEIADIVEKSPEFVRTRIHRNRLKYRNFLTETKDTA
jgi:RNA polymerase sigma factor (sigma-70 family)